MNWKPNCDVRALKARATMNRLIRDFFYERGVMEVETPALSAAANTDPAIDSFAIPTSSTHRYLHTSPEYPMKRLLAAGSGDIYQLCKVWRQDESGSRHNPEFTLLEWYRVGFKLEQLMQEVNELVKTIIPHLKSSRFISYAELFEQQLNINPHTATSNALAACAKTQGINIKGDMDVSAWRDLLLTHCIEPNFPKDRLTFVYDYPQDQCALAQVHTEGQHTVAKRFEFYLGAIELGNGYQELVDAELNAKILRGDAKRRAHPLPVDERFLAAMQAGMPETSGVALGVDRLLMGRLQQDQLPKVVSFVWDNA